MVGVLLGNIPCGCEKDKNDPRLGTTTTCPLYNGAMAFIRRILGAITARILIAIGVVIVVVAAIAIPTVNEVTDLFSDSAQVSLEQNQRR